MTGKILPMKDAGWMVLGRRLHSRPDHEAHFIILPRDVLPNLVPWRLAGIQMVGHWSDDISDETVLFVALTPRARNPNTNVMMDKDELVALGLLLANGGPIIHGSDKGIMVYHRGVERVLSRDLAPEALAKAYAWIRRTDDRSDDEREFIWDGIIAPNSWISAMSLTATGAWDGQYLTGTEQGAKGC